MYRYDPAFSLLVLISTRSVVNAFLISNRSLSDLVMADLFNLIYIRSLKIKTWIRKKRQGCSFQEISLLKV